jgi:hypothetical protein
MVDYIASDGYARACYYLCLVPDGRGRKQPCCSILMQGETSLHSQEQGPLYLNKPASDLKGHCDSARCLLNMTEQHLGSYVFTHSLNLKFNLTQSLFSPTQQAKGPKNTPKTLSHHLRSPRTRTKPNPQSTKHSQFNHPNPSPPTNLPAPQMTTTKTVHSLASTNGHQTNLHIQRGRPPGPNGPPRPHDRTARARPSPKVLGKRSVGVGVLGAREKKREECTSLRVCTGDLSLGCNGVGLAVFGGMRLGCSLYVL